jgi:hypothetical protein
LKGLIQAQSAYFSFKVLPDLKDAGYYSDKAVLSRKFVHENGCYQLFTVFGSLYYVDSVRAVLQSTFAGRVLESIFVIWPYVLIRPWFPTPRFKDAGTAWRSRTLSEE